MFVQPRSAHSSSSSSPGLPEGYKVDPKQGPMLRYQASLPHLPVPALSSTLAKYLESIRPHLTPAEYARSEAAVREFGASPRAAELQKRLEARAAEPGTVNWIADWWNDAAYMAYRDPVVVNVSYFFIHMADPAIQDAPKRAATLIKAMLPFRTLVETAQLEPEKIRGAPLCMDSYKWLFHASRYPNIPSDTAYKFDPATHNHVVFVRNNRFFEVQLARTDGTELSAADLETAIADVIRQADTHTGVPFGALTSENRDNWTHARKRLIEASPANEAALERIESAMIVVALDNSSPTSRNDLSWGAWVGNGRNRWYDKHQLVVWDNGRSAFLGEHACMDGTPTLRLNEFILGSLAADGIELGSPTPSTLLTPPSEIVLTANDAVLADVKEAEKNFDKLVGSHDLQVLHYDAYGKNLIKQFKTSPDAWAQLVKQLAYYKFKGRPAVTYESAQTRKFQRGRTEVIRAASEQSKAWVDAMVNPNATDAKRAALFRSAVSRHVQYSTWAADGQGVDRHLFGLKKVLKEGEALPEIYKDPAFSRSSHWELSTSQLSSQYLDGWGYGEVVPDGYGLSYSIGDEYIRWTITSLKLDSEAFKACIADAATETRQMMERARQTEGIIKTKL
ncbi:acyltransferase ChoActase COT CPT [Lactarius akahatsu]|uniref:Carnitine O-acetyltransferase, mitochondrial n=1 Tax=Lactarius akahatsu TaxID=416441 RepID=A0AAD4LS31_9AGAM|nr:acyltransferase ChoActase COT CPT [Lactarius akahatsu]